MKQRLSTSTRERLTTRLLPLFLGFAAIITLIVLRIVYLQVAMGEEFRKQSELNRIRHQTIPALRGVIRDTRGQVLAADEPVFQLVRDRGSKRNSPEVLNQLHRLARELKLPGERLEERYRSGRRTLFRGLTDEQRIWFEENSEKFADFDVLIRPKRVYQFDSKMAPVIGYTGEISPRELNHRRGSGLTQGDIVGKMGIEKSYDDYLRGREGIRWIETTARGDFLRTLESPPPIPPSNGADLELYVDAELQTRIARSFPADSEGAAIVMEIPSGKVRALYSHPSYDPNQLVLGSSRETRRLLTNQRQPLLNRAVQSRFPPGSTFKILVYLAALQSPRFQPSQTFYCGGGFRFGGRTYHCWKEEGHGTLNLDEAVVHSCNVYFFKLVRALGYQPIVRLARQFGFQQPTGIDLPSEVASQLSSPRWKRETLGRPWYPGDPLNAVIGQGFTLVSPIKQAQLLGTLLSGREVRPSLARSSRTPEPARNLPISRTHINSLIRTLDRVTDEGTGYWAQHTPSYQNLTPDRMGKTGTVQKASRKDGNDTPPSDAWFVSAAPTDQPRYVVIVFRANGNSGGRVAAPHARRIYEFMKELGYFNRPARSERPPGGSGSSRSGS